MILGGDCAAMGPCRMSMSRRPCASHSEPQSVEARLSVLMAKLEVDNTNVEFLNCRQTPDALRIVTKGIAAKGKDVKVRQKQSPFDLLALRKELVELFDEGTRAQESCSVAIETIAQELSDASCIMIYPK